MDLSWHHTIIRKKERLRRKISILCVLICHRCKIKQRIKIIMSLASLNLDLDSDNIKIRDCARIWIWFGIFVFPFYQVVLSLSKSENLLQSSFCHHHFKNRLHPSLPHYIIKLTQTSIINLKCIYTKIEIDIYIHFSPYHLNLLYSLSSLLDHLLYTCIYSPFWKLLISLPRLLEGSTLYRYTKWEIINVVAWNGFKTMI